MDEKLLSVVFWGYSPEYGDKRFMMQDQKVFMSVVVDKNFSPCRRMQEFMWPEVDFIQTRICLMGNIIGAGAAFATCKVDITRANDANPAIRFVSLENLLVTSGLKTLDANPDYEIWKAISFIEHHMMPVK